MEGVCTGDLLNMKIEPAHLSTENGIQQMMALLKEPVHFKGLSYNSM